MDVATLVSPYGFELIICCLSIHVLAVNTFLSLSFDFFFSELEVTIFGCLVICIHKLYAKTNLFLLASMNNCTTVIMVTVTN